MSELYAHLAGIDWNQWRAPALAGVRIVLIVAAAWVAITARQRLVRGRRIRIQARPEGVEAARRAERADHPRPDRPGHDRRGVEIPFPHVTVCPGRAALADEAVSA